ncbi:MAG TPA: TetR/AcrR family transcriptional regulator [Accumulibacter sp.]|jgi:AcrR family transcriptional regulator|nr:TetR/AcrR family transcriptional regulator [Accumulibacter sp.]HQC78935.1 TetR/AcrR family transcriptional regulator [Accumulibacter sp.]
MPAKKKKAGAPLETNRREELLRVAARLFVEKGFEATTTRDIADAAGMRSGSPFYHFRSKQELLKTVMIDGIENGARRLHAAIAAVDDPERRLRTMIRVHLDNLLAGDCRTPMLLFESRSLDSAARDEIAAAADRYQQAWQTTLNELATSGRLRGSARTSRLLLFGMLNWSSQWYRPDGALSLDDIGDAAAALLLA